MKEDLNQRDCNHETPDDVGKKLAILIDAWFQGISPNPPSPISSENNFMAIVRKPQSSSISWLSPASYARGSTQGVSTPAHLKKMTVLVITNKNS